VRLDVGEYDEISLASERIMGDKIARELLQDPDAIDDPILTEAVQGIWLNLLDAASQLGVLSPEMRATFAWRVVLGKDRTINAFALPGGYLGLHLGLIGVTTRADELASVLAHELSHVIQRHISRGMAQQSKMAPALLAAIVVGLVAARKSEALAQATVAGSQALGMQLQLNYSRDMEREADRVGYALAQKAGYSPQGFVSLFEKLDNANRLSDNNQYPYLRTHPLTTERIGDMKSRTLQEVPAPGLLLQGADWAYTLIAARARALSTTDLEALRLWTLEVQGHPVSPPAIERQLTAWVMASQYYLRVQQPQRAVSLLQALSQKVQASPEARRVAGLMQAELDLALARPANVVPLLKVRPRHRPELLFGAQAALVLGGTQASEAVDALQLWLADAPLDAMAWQLLARLYEQQGHPLRQIRALAEAQGAQGDLQGAIDRLRAARALPISPNVSRSDQEIDQSIIQARLQAFTQALAIQTGK
jgi:predicted Zn-dependent protease